jgi:hypothetical protein
MRENELKDAIQIYFDSNNVSDEQKMSEVFHDSAHLYQHGEDGNLSDWNKDFFLGVMASEKDAVAKSTFPVVNEILSIDFTSDKTAIARVKVNVLDAIFTDILSFICIDGRWWIISKLAVKGK